MRVGALLSIFAALLLGIAIVSGGGSPASAAVTGCPSARGALEQGKLDQARNEYLDLLVDGQGPECAEEGLRKTTVEARAEERLCAEGKALAEAGDGDGAQKRYVEALGKNTESECALAGLKPPTGKSVKDRVGEWSDLIPKALIAVFAALGTALLIYAAARRLLHPSLVIKPFADDGVETKVGAAVAGLVEEELISLSDRGERFNDGFELDFVVANVELLARDEDLTTAMGGLAETSQLGLMVSLLALIDRTFGKRSLVAEGELMPPGGQGDGLMLALYRHNELRAREAAWAGAEAPEEVVEGGGEEDEDGNGGPAADPEPYYALAPTAASWIQYQAARSLDSTVGLMTDSPLSFALLARGIDQQRQGWWFAAELFYGMALAADPDNVAALFNLAMLQARVHGAYEEADLLLRDAIGVLAERYGAGL